MNTYTFDEIPVGLKCRFDRKITAEMEDTFRGLSGDENPLHRDDLFAREGIPGGAVPLPCNIRHADCFLIFDLMRDVHSGEIFPDPQHGAEVPPAGVCG